MFGKVQTSLRQQPSLKSALIQRLQFSKILTMPESEFAKLIAEIENDSLFFSLLYPPDGGPKAVSIQRYPHTRLAQSFYEPKEELIRASGNVDVESILQKHSQIVSLIKKIGQAQFEKFFLYKEGSQTIEEIASSCNLSPDSVRKIQNLVNEISVHSEFFHPSSLTAGAVHYVPIAKIEQEEDGSFVISFLAPHLSRGRYLLNRERIQELKKKLDREKKKNLTQLLKKMEWINLRQDTLQKILNEIIQTQELYLRQKVQERLFPLSQRELAKRLSVAPSTVSRAIFGKSLLLPWGEEKPLKELFLKRKTAVSHRISEILETIPKEQREKITDEQLKTLLQQRYHLRISRRSINLYRHELVGNEK